MSSGATTTRITRRRIPNSGEAELEELYIESIREKLRGKTHEPTFTSEWIVMKVDLTEQERHSTLGRDLADLYGARLEFKLDGNVFIYKARPRAIRMEFQGVLMILGAVLAGWILSRQQSFFSSLYDMWTS